MSSPMTFPELTPEILKGWTTRETQQLSGGLPANDTPINNRDKCMSLLYLESMNDAIKNAKEQPGVLFPYGNATVSKGGSYGPGIFIFNNDGILWRLMIFFNPSHCTHMNANKLSDEELDGKGKYCPYYITLYNLMQ